jgi:hypothetical protein
MSQGIGTDPHLRAGAVPRAVRERRAASGWRMLGGVNGKFSGELREELQLSAV